MTLESTITCPHCGHSKTETMPTDACQFFYKCEQCGTVLRPQAEDCCVFCSYGSVKCPSKQVEQGAA
ncbi:MAG TPA: GDCCVxC domain-containing (seleno)protein [Candidatus Kapabacteria bacterium]|nr:GDCCVxC domain-containing (seleno)protein [Candidatus Kapabacteria bacterium]